MKIAKKLAVAACVASAFTMMNTQAEETKAPVSVSQAGTALPAGVTQGPSIEGVTEYRLANGLRVVLFPDASKDTATVNMTYLVGSRQENYGETGMAHLLEHLIFKGSKNFPNPTKEFTNRGFRMNGSTWLDRTNYYVSFTATEDNLKFALAWSADAMRNSFIAKKDLDSEMSVVRNEYEMGENRPSSVLMKRMQSMMYDWHNYGKSTIGNRSDIEHVRIENLQAFYHRYYRPDNAVLTVSGKFDVQKTLEWIVKDFSLIQNPKETLPAEWTVEPTADGERVFEIRRKGETQMVAVGYRIPSALHPDALGVEVATEVLADSPNGRLYDALVKTGLAANVFGYAVGAKEPGFVIFGASVKKGESLEKVKDKLIETIEGSLKQKPMTSKELNRTKAQMETMYERAFADPCTNAPLPIRKDLVSAYQSTLRWATGDFSSTAAIRLKTSLLSRLTVQQTNISCVTTELSDSSFPMTILSAQRSQKLRARMNCWLITSRRELLKRLRLSTLRSITSTRGHSVLISAI